MSFLSRSCHFLKKSNVKLPVKLSVIWFYIFPLWYIQDVIGHILLRIPFIWAPSLFGGGNYEALLGISRPINGIGVKRGRLLLGKTCSLFCWRYYIFSPVAQFYRKAAHLTYMFIVWRFEIKPKIEYWSQWFQIIWIFSRTSNYLCFRLIIQTVKSRFLPSKSLFTE